MIPAALLCVIVSGCADQQPTSPKPLPRVARDQNVPFNKFFVAWSEGVSTDPIQTQVFAIDRRQTRQYAPFAASEGVLAYARANPGQIYFDGDEPDQYCVAPRDYAVMYHDFVVTLRSVDPTARVSPAGVAEPNWHCCPEDDLQCQRERHGLGYADQFYNAYVQIYGVAPPVSEWRFHNFGLSVAIGDVASWWAEVDQMASWSVAHGANMVLGAWGFMGWRVPASEYQEYIKQAMNRLMNDPRINEAVYWSHEPMAHSVHYLVNTDGSLTPVGQTFANPLTDVPFGASTVGAGNGQATLQWVNTTKAWATEAEFWVQAPGSNSFVYRSTERTGPGIDATAFVAFNPGEYVKGRVRYYNRFGQAAWSSFSDAVFISLSEAPKKSGSLKGPRLCFIGIKTQRCD